MKKSALIAALAILSACSQQAPTPTAETSDVPAASAAAANIAADGKASVGKFKITTHDGKVVMEEDKADSTYVTTMDGKVVETGKWEQKSPNIFCFTKDGKDAKQQCNDEKVENGVWTTKNAKGEVSKVERVEG